MMILRGFNACADGSQSIGVVILTLLAFTLSFTIITLVKTSLLIYFKVQSLVLRLINARL
jgi:hypothetical protein